MVGNEYWVNESAFCRSTFSCHDPPHLKECLPRIHVRFSFKFGIFSVNWSPAAMVPPKLAIFGIITAGPGAVSAPGKWLLLRKGHEKRNSFSRFAESALTTCMPITWALSLKSELASRANNPPTLVLNGKEFRK